MVGYVTDSTGNCPVTDCYHNHCLCENFTELFNLLQRRRKQFPNGGHWLDRGHASPEN